MATFYNFKSKEKKKNKKNTSLQVSKLSRNSPGVFESTKEDFTQKMNPKPKSKARITNNSPALKAKY